MSTRLPDQCAILVERDQAGGLTVWILDPPDLDNPWPVCRQRPGWPNLRIQPEAELLHLARWILKVCIGGDAIERFDCALVQEVLCREHTFIWSIPVWAVRDFVAARQTPMLENQP